MCSSWGKKNPLWQQIRPMCRQVAVRTSGIETYCYFLNFLSYVIQPKLVAGERLLLRGRGTTCQRNSGLIHQHPLLNHF